MKKWKTAIVVLACICVCVSLTGCKSAMEKGMENLQNKDYEKAINQFEKSIEDEKNTAESYRGLGIAYWEKKDYKNSKKAFSAAIENGTKKTGTIYNFLGVCAMQEEDYKGALGFLRLGQECKGNKKALNQEMAYNEVVCYEKLYRWSEAKEKMEKYVKQYPDDKAATREYEFLESR